MLEVDEETTSGRKNYTLVLPIILKIKDNPKEKKAFLPYNPKCPSKTIGKIIRPNNPAFPNREPRSSRKPRIWSERETPESTLRG